MLISLWKRLPSARIHARWVDWADAMDFNQNLLGAGLCKPRGQCIELAASQWSGKFIRRPRYRSRAPVPLLNRIVEGGKLWDTAALLCIKRWVHDVDFTGGIVLMYTLFEEGVAIRADIQRHAWTRQLQSSFSLTDFLATITVAKPIKLRAYRPARLAGCQKCCK